MRPDIEGLVSELEQAEDAVSSGAARVTIPRDNRVLLEGLKNISVDPSFCKPPILLHHNGVILVPGN